MLRIIICILIYTITAKPILEHGDFDVAITRYEECKGPKRKNCSTFKGAIEEGIFLSFNFDAFEDMTTIKGKVVGILNSKELLRLNIKNICDHIFFRPLFQLMFRETERCGVYKGNYQFRVNVAELSHKFYGDNFIYGNWTFSALFYNDYCNLYCSHVGVRMSPKIKT